MKILTFDIEDWFHLLDNPKTSTVQSWQAFDSRIDSGVERILGSLRKNNQKATFFILGWIAEKYPHIVKKIDAEGHHIGSHSFAHQLAYNQSPKQFEHDLLKSKDVIENVLGKSINSYRAPGFSITENNLWAFEVLLKSGFELDSSVFPSGRAHGGFTGFGSDQPMLLNVRGKYLKLFPINSKKILGNSFIYSGGGYFRLFPPSLLKYWFKRDEYVMTYFHPRDFDAEQPLVPGLSRLREFKSYVGLGTALPKLESIIESNKFVNLVEADKMINWDVVKTIKYPFEGDVMSNT